MDEFTPTELRIAEAMSRHGYQLPVIEMTPFTAMSQDARIDGIDVYDFYQDLENQFGWPANEVPWQRFSDQRASFYGCATLFVPLWLIWRIPFWLFGGEYIPLPNGGEERLTIRHLAKVMDEGSWSEPCEET